jgi:hypothetical protein
MRRAKSKYSSGFNSEMAAELCRLYNKHPFRYVRPAWIASDPAGSCRGKRRSCASTQVMVTDFIVDTPVPGCRFWYPSLRAKIQRLQKRLASYWCTHRAGYSWLFVCGESIHTIPTINPLFCDWAREGPCGPVLRSKFSIREWHVSAGFDTHGTVNYYLRL